MAILLNYSGGENAPWAKAFSELLPAMPLRIFPDIPDPQEISYAVVWDHPQGDLANYPNLKAILNMGAGTDILDRDPNLPKVPIVRLIDPDVSNDMAQYALYWAMHFHRGFEQYRKYADTKQWRRIEVMRACEFRVTVLGLGLIGSFIAQRFSENGFQAQAWNRSPKQLDGVICFDGDTGLSQALANSDVVVNCLPLTSQTHLFLNAERLGLLPRGACLINVSRGAVIDDGALVALLESGHLAGAALDTFVQEPLPVDSPYWHLDNVFVTPHTAGPTYAKSAAKPIADNINRIERGEAPFPIYLPPQHHD